MKEFINFVEKFLKVQTLIIGMKHDQVNIHLSLEKEAGYIITKGAQIVSH